MSLWIEANDKGLRFVLVRAYAHGERLGGVRGSFAPGEDAPYRRIATAQHGFGGTVSGDHTALRAIGIRLLAERPDLDGKQCRFGNGRCANNGDLDLADAGANQIDRLRRRMGQIDDAALHEGTAIDD